MQARVTAATDRCADRSVGRSPAQNKNIGIAVRVIDPKGCDGCGYALDLGLPGSDHEVVVRRVVRDVAGAILLLQPADPVLKPLRSWGSPGPGQRRCVALVGPELRRTAFVDMVWLGGEQRVDRR